MSLPTPRPLNILLVEDDEVDVMNVRRAFQQHRIMNPLVVASDGVEALALLRSGRVPSNRRLILLDLNMPRMNGIEFLRELRGDPTLHTAPVVVLNRAPHDQPGLFALPSSRMGARLALGGREARGALGRAIGELADLLELG